MIPIHGLFEGHLVVANLDRAMKFYGDTLGLELAHRTPERRVAFYWLGGAGRSMLGVWEGGAGPQRMRLHLAFSVELADLLAAPARMRAAGVAPLDFLEQPCDEPVVLAWMPAASVYFHDPDGNLLEYITMLDSQPRPELGALPWKYWLEATEA
jgi:lactoylglutathione lyase